MGASVHKVTLRALGSGAAVRTARVSSRSPQELLEEASAQEVARAHAAGVAEGRGDSLAAGRTALDAAVDRLDTAREAAAESLASQAIELAVGIASTLLRTELDAGRYDLERIVREELDPETMQFHRSAVRKGLLETDDDGDVHTRVVEGGCIFANREGFAAGEGCALHHLAVRRGEDPMTHKPTVCWQVPLHRTIEEKVGNDGGTIEVHTVHAFERGDWGEGGADFTWWCFDDGTAFVGDRPLFRTMELELRTMVGDAVYDELAGYLEDRAARGTTVRFLPTA